MISFVSKAVCTRLYTLIERKEKKRPMKAYKEMVVKKKKKQVWSRQTSDASAPHPHSSHLSHHLQGDQKRSFRNLEKDGSLSGEKEIWRILPKCRGENLVWERQSAQGYREIQGVPSQMTFKESIYLSFCAEYRCSKNCSEKVFYCSFCMQKTRDSKWLVLLLQKLSLHA